MGTANDATTRHPNERCNPSPCTASETRDASLSCHGPAYSFISSFHFVSFARPARPSAAIIFMNLGISETNGLSRGISSASALGCLFIFFPPISVIRPNRWRGLAGTWGVESQKFERLQGGLLRVSDGRLFWLSAIARRDGKSRTASRDGALGPLGALTSRARSARPRSLRARQ